MKPTNLMVLAQGFEAAPHDLLAVFEAQLSERDVPLAAVKEHEAASVTSLVSELREHGALASGIFEGFVFSFRIPQISSEFDLLKITRDVVVNIELKSEDVGGERIARQLARNRYYLAPLERDIYTFTYVSGTGELFEMGEAGTVAHASFDRLVTVLRQAGAPHEGVVEDLFRVSNYLVSPLNDTERFLDGSYFLTNHQAQIKASFLSACESAGATTASSPAFVVYGSVGTGKTLLLYDLARSLATSRPPCVVHCGILSEGHDKLNERQDQFCIVSAKHVEREDLRRYGALLVDEAQRMWPSQLRRVAQAAAKQRIPLYVSLDRRQVLTRDERDCDVESIVRAACPNVSVWELSRKIRTNWELVAFIRALFGLHGAPKSARTSHVKICYAADSSGARQLVEAYRARQYCYLVLDEPTIEGCPTPNLVIGQEFDKVVMAVGPTFDLEGDFRARQLLYQGLTRARSDIALVVYGNPAFFARLLHTTSSL